MLNAIRNLLREGLISDAQVDRVARAVAGFSTITDYRSIPLGSEVAVSVAVSRIVRSARRRVAALAHGKALRSPQGVGGFGRTRPPS